MTELESLVAKINSMPSPERLRLAAALIEAGRGKLAHSIAEGVVLELGAALTLAELPETFPILWPHSRDGIARYENLECPRFVPAALIRAHEKQCSKNHGGQTVSRLKERGGLCASEAVAVLEDRPWKPMADRDAIARLKELCK